jgi:hypothetical protein
MLMRNALFPAQHFIALPLTPGSLSFMSSLFARVKEGVRQNNLVFPHLLVQKPLFRFDQSPFRELGIERVELINEALIDLGALPTGVEVFKCFESVPLIPWCCLAYLIIK